jgi:hypothetical protein
VLGLSPGLAGSGSTIRSIDPDPGSYERRFL